jgi:molybdate transport system permease protein
VSSRTFGTALSLAALVVLAFLLLPVLAIFTRVAPGTLLDELSSPVVRDALRVTIKTNLVAILVVLALGTPTAFLVATRSFRGRALVLTLIELPLVLPPAVAGIGLLAAFGRAGLLGGTLDFFGFTVGLGTQAAVVLAVVFVAGPFYVRPAIAAFEAVDPTLLGAARTLGAGPARTFFRVALPLAAGGLGAGTALAFARGLGEFGATIMFAGSLQGVTQTLSLAIYQEFDIDFDSALAISALLVLVSAVLLLSVKLIVGWRSTYVSLISFARSPSTSS